MEKSEAEKIVQGLVGCKCITKELAVILEELITRAQANAKSNIEAPYGREVESWKERLSKLEAAEDALKSLDLCE